MLNQISWLNFHSHFLIKLIGTDCKNSFVMVFLWLTMNKLSSLAFDLEDFKH